MHHIYSLFFLSLMYFNFFVVLIWQFSFTLVIICFSLLHVNLPKAPKGFYIFFKKQKAKTKTKKLCLGCIVDWQVSRMEALTVLSLSAYGFGDMEFHLTHEEIAQARELARA